MCRFYVAWQIPASGKKSGLYGLYVLFFLEGDSPEILQVFCVKWSPWDSTGMGFWGSKWHNPHVSFTSHPMKPRYLQGHPKWRGSMAGGPTMG
jgi:hypothetical protein